jgi:hypothetical protein
LVQKRVVFFPIFSKKRIFSKKYVVSTYFANVRLTHALYDDPDKPAKRRPIREEAAREGRRGADAYAKVFRHLLSTTVSPASSVKLTSVPNGALGL